MLVYLNDKLVPEKDAKISVFDHGLLYGDGVFEGIRFYNNKIFKLKEHITRLFESANTICLKHNLGFEKLTTAIVETIKANKLCDGYLRVVITRGTGSLGLDPNLCKKPTLFIIASSIKLYPEEYYQNGLKLITCSTRRQTVASLNPSIKSLNYLNNILAKIEAVNAGCLEAIMLNEQGFVAECTGDNIFILKNNQLYTPPISSGALRGITRDSIFELAEKIKIKCSPKNISLHDVYNADECFLTGTAAEIIPVIELDSRKINNKKVGNITKTLINDYRSFVKNNGFKIN